MYYERELDRLICEAYINSDMTLIDIANKYLTSKPTVTRTVNKYKLPKRNALPTVLSKELEEILCLDYLEGELEGLQICSKHNVTPNKLYDTLRKNNIPLRTKTEKSFKNEIIESYNEDNLSKHDIAAKFGTSLYFLNRILERNSIPDRDRIATDKMEDWKIKCDETFFEKLDSKYKCWVAGILSGDGHITEGGLDWKYQLTITLQEKDIEILEKIKELMKAEQPIYKCEQIIPKTGNIFHGVKLNICRKKIWEDLNKLGIDNNKSQVFTMPKMTNDLVPHYLRGVVDSDGGFHVTKNNIMMFSIACSVLSFLEEVEIILREHCNLPFRKVIFSSGCWHLTYSSNNDSRKIFNYLYPDETGPFLTRKYKYAKNHFNNLDNGLRTRNIGEGPVSQFGNDSDKELTPIAKSKPGPKSGWKLLKNQPELPEVAEQSKPQSIKDFIKQKAELRKSQNETFSN